MSKFWHFIGGNMEKQDPISHESLSPGRIFNPEIINKNILNNVLQHLLLKTANNQTSNLISVEPL